MVVAPVTVPKSVSLVVLAVRLPLAIVTPFPVRFISLLSTTVTVCVAVAVFPFASFAVQVTVVVPIGKTEGALFENVTVPQLSAPVAVPKVTPEAVQSPASTVTVTFVGAVIVGFVLSLIITF